MLCSPSVSDLEDVIRAGLSIRAPQRDHGALTMYFTMYAAGIARARRVRQGGVKPLQHYMGISEAETPLYKGAGEYLQATALNILFTSVQQIVHVWSNTENLLSLHAVRYILRMLTDSVRVGVSPFLPWGFFVLI